jgi:hypothetical protein
MNSKKSPVTQKLQLSMPKAEYILLQDLARDMCMPVSGVAAFAIKQWLIDNHKTLKELYGPEQ